MAKKYRAVVCAIAKNENLYIRDWVLFYLNLGFDQVFIYDNNETDAPDIREVLKGIDKVTIFDWRGAKYKGVQVKSYNRFYQRYNDQFDWCLYCDIDEFLFGVTNINEFLKKFKVSEQIRIRWKLFGDDDIIERDTSIPVYDFFKKPVLRSLHRNLRIAGDLEIQGKCMVRGGIPDFKMNNPHSAKTTTRKLKSVLPSGAKAGDGVRIKENYNKETIYLHHYMTKTLAEFVAQKLNRHDAVYGTDIALDYFWRINQKTPAKLKWLKDHNYIA